MQFLELTVTVMLKKDVYFADSGCIIGKNINKSMLLDEVLKELHPKKEYKNYVFDSFYPLEKDKFYKKGKLYIFKIRGVKKDLIQKMRVCLEKLQSVDFDVISVSEKVIEKRKIKELYTMTPVVITIDNRPWLQNNDLEVFKQRLEDNLEKKYKNFYGSEIDIKGKFIKSLTFKNRTPMAFNYKGIKLLANKLSIQVQDNEEAQNAAFIARAVGLGEKNSVIGAGFCK